MTWKRLGRDFSGRLSYQLLKSMVREGAFQFDKNRDLDERDYENWSKNRFYHEHLIYSYHNFVLFIKWARDWSSKAVIYPIMEYFCLFRSNYQYFLILVPGSYCSKWQIYHETHGKWWNSVPGFNWMGKNGTQRLFTMLESPGSQRNLRLSHQNIQKGVRCRILIERLEIFKTCLDELSFSDIPIKAFRAILNETCNQCGKI